MFGLFGCLIKFNIMFKFIKLKHTEGTMINNGYCMKYSNIVDIIQDK